VRFSVRAYGPWGRMIKMTVSKNGFTLVEVLITVGITLALIPIVITLLINCQVLSSIAKHKVEAAYAAQQTIETQRQEPISYFAPRLATQNAVSPAIVGLVPLDTKGNYSNVNCNTNPNIICGTETITIKPETFSGLQSNYTAVYQPAIGSAITYNIIAHINVQISWFEIGLNRTISESYAADFIVNDPMLN